jgi:hypothetical protein
MVELKINYIYEILRINAINGRKIIKAKKLYVDFKEWKLSDHCQLAFNNYHFRVLLPWAKSKTIAISLWRNVARRRCIAFHGTEKKCLKFFLKSLYYSKLGILAYVIVDLSEIGHLRLFYFMRDFLPYYL